MFFTKNKIKPYPNRGVLEDVLMREGYPTAESFTPFSGCAEMMKQQFQNNGADSGEFVTVKDILNYAKDFDVDVARPTDDSADRSYRARDVVDYNRRLEDITDDYIVKYVAEAIIGFKKGNEGQNQMRYELNVIEEFRDEETGDYIDQSDTINMQQDYSTQELIDAKRKLPYLLKQLHNGSLYYGGSLLSFIIAAEKYNRAATANSLALKPMHVYTEPVYKMLPNGKIGGRFQKSDNAAPTFRALFAWVSGGYPQDPYYKAYLELIKVLDVLDLDITEEDARDYDGEYIDNLVCTYIASNEEYLDSYGYVDMKIKNMLEPDKLFSVIRQLSGDESVEPLKATVSMKAENLGTNLSGPILRNPGFWREDVPKVKRVIKYTQGLEDNELDKYIRRLSEYNGLLKHVDNTYITIDLGKFMPGRWGLLTIAGKIILFEDFEFNFNVIDGDDAIRCMKEGRMYGNEWRTITL